jgi:hypothetical protein
MEWLTGLYIYILPWNDRDPILLGYMEYSAVIIWGKIDKDPRSNRGTLHSP